MSIERDMYTPPTDKERDDDNKKFIRLLMAPAVIGAIGIIILVVGEIYYSIK